MLRSLGVAAVTLLLIGAAGWGIQAVALARPTASQLELVKTLQALSGFHGSEATLDLDGRRYQTLCTQHWYPGERVADVLVGGRIVRQVDNRLLGRSTLSAGEFDLAGCPRALRSWLAAELLRGASIGFHEIKAGSARLDEIVLHPRTLPLVPFVAASTGLPVRLTLTATHLRGTSVLHFGAVR